MSIKEYKPETISDVPVMQEFQQDGDLYKSTQPLTAYANQNQTELSSGAIINKLPAGTIYKSANFVTGSSGWQIDGQGNAEFQSITAVGSITATSGAIGGWNIVTGYIYSCLLYTSPSPRD